MPQVSIGQVENLEDLVRGLESVRESLETACQEQIVAANGKFTEAYNEVQNSENMLASACQAEQEALQNLEASESVLSAAESALSSCEAQPDDEDGDSPDCSCEENDYLDAQDRVKEAHGSVEKAVENRSQMEQRVENSKQALAMAEKTLVQVQQECNLRLASVCQSIEMGKARLLSAQQSLDAYLAANPPARQFYSWLHWHPERGKPVTPDIIRDRMYLSVEQQRLLQEYLYDRNPAYRNLVNKFRREWATANGDVERNMVNRNARIHLSGEFAEQMARHALDPLGGTIETQGRTYVGDSGRYTKTDLIVKDLHVPVILGRGEDMGAPVGGSIAFEIKCGRAEYLYREKDHMIFQAEGHKGADAHCTLCSRDIHDLPPEKEEELRKSLRDAGSPMIGMLPTKNDIDKSCLEFIQQGAEEEKT